MEFLIVTGLSGAGKTQAAHFLEDLGYYCVDNMPSALLQPFAEFCIASQGRFTKVALVTDVRAHESFEQLFRALDSLRALDCTFRILFLEAPESTLVRRYKETRRRHPLAEPGKTVQAALREEIALMQPVRDRADYIINTQNLTLAQLHKKLCRLFTETGEAKLPINVVAFGYKYGIPIDADMVIDVRFLPNPFYIAKYKHSSGRVKEVAQYIASAPVTQDFLTKLYDFMDFLVHQFEAAGKTQFTIAIGCTGGMHRSVFVTEKLGQYLKRKHARVSIEHRDLHRNPVEHDANDIMEGKV